MYTHGVQEEKSHKESDLDDDKHMAHLKGGAEGKNFRHLNPTDFPWQLGAWHSNSLKSPSHTVTAVVPVLPSSIP